MSIPLLCGNYRDDGRPQVVNLFLSWHHTAQDIQSRIEAEPDLLAGRDEKGRGLLCYAAMYEIHRSDSLSKLFNEIITSYGFEVHAADVLTTESEKLEPRRIDKDGNTVLHYVVQHCPQLIASCIDAGLDPNVRNTSGQTPLYQLIDSLSTVLARSPSEAHEAYLHDVCERIKTLCKKGADPDATVSSADCLASLERVVLYKLGLSVAGALLEAKANPNKALFTALFHANEFDYAHLLQKYGAYLENPDEIIKIAECSDDRVFTNALPCIRKESWNICNDKGYTPLCGAVKSGTLERVLNVIKQGVTPQVAALITALHEAHDIESAYQIATCLIAHGVACHGSKGALNRDLRNDSGKCVAKRGTTPASFVSTDSFVAYPHACHTILYALIQAMKSGLSLSNEFDILATKREALIKAAGGQLAKPDVALWQVLSNSSAERLGDIQDTIHKLYFASAALTCSAYEKSVQKLITDIEQIRNITDLVSRGDDHSIIVGAINNKDRRLLDAICNKVQQALNVEPLSDKKQHVKKAQKQYENALCASERVIYALIQHRVKSADTYVAQLIAGHRSDWVVPVSLWDVTYRFSGDATRAKIAALLAQRSPVSMYDHKGQTALIRLSKESLGNTRAVKTLVDCGAPVDQQELNTGCTALHYAVLLGKVSMARELIKSGANQHQCNAVGQSPEMINSMIIDNAYALIQKKGDPQDCYKHAVAIANIFTRNECAF